MTEQERFIKARDSVDNAVSELNISLRMAAKLGLNVNVNAYLSQTGKGSRSIVDCWEVAFEAWAPIPGRHD